MTKRACVAPAFTSPSLVNAKYWSLLRGLARSLKYAVLPNPVSASSLSLLFPALPFFVVIKINMNESLKIDCSHSILSDHIMLQKISILTTRISIRLTQIRLKIIRILILIKRNQNNLNLISKLILLIILIFLTQKQEFANSVNRILHSIICFISIFRRRTA